MRLNEPAQCDLEWWGGLSVEDSTIILVAPTAITQLWSDASLWCCGTVLDGQELLSDFPEPLQSKHIGLIEYYAILAFLQALGPCLWGKHIALYYDNQPTVFMIRLLNMHSVCC